MNREQKEKIIRTFRRCGIEKERELLIEAAELTGWLLADAELNGFTRPQAIEPETYGTDDMQEAACIAQQLVCDDLESGAIEFVEVP